MTMRSTRRDRLRTLVCVFAISLICGIAGVDVAAACSCRGPSFWEAARKAKTIVLADVVKHDRYSERWKAFMAMDVSVKEVLRGKDDRQLLRFIGGPCCLCDIQVEQFPVGSTWAFIVDGPERLNWCDGRWISVVPDTRADTKDQSDDVITLDALRKRLKRARAKSSRRPRHHVR